MRLTYAIKFVKDMDQAIAFYRDKLGLPVRFHSPSWTEFETGETTLALHPASPSNPAGSVQLGMESDDLERFCAEAGANGIPITSAPREVHGTNVARFLDADGSEISISAVRPMRAGE